MRRVRAVCRHVDWGALAIVLLIVLLAALGNTIAPTTH